MGIFNFANETEFNQHVPSETDSELYHIDSIDEIRYNHVNTEVVYPKWGDALYVENTGDANNLTKHYVDGDSLNPSLLPNTWTPVGVVVANHRNKIYVHRYKDYISSSGTSQWASAWLYEITGMIIDGNEHSIAFRQPKESGYLDVGTFTYTSSTLEDFCQDLDTWLRANRGGISAGGTWNYNWHCEYMENYAGVMSCIVIIDDITNYKQYERNAITNTSGISSLANMANMIPECTSLLRNNEGPGTRVGVNYQRLLEWGNSNTTIANPTSNVQINNASDIVSRSQFNNNQYCVLLRNEYGTYEKYIESVMIRYPTLRSIVGSERGNVKDWNTKLGTRTHKRLDGTSIPTFPIFKYALDLNVNTEGMTSGNWYVPGIEETYWIMKDLTYGLSGITTSNCDRFNKTLNKMDGNLVSVSNGRCLCVRYDFRYAWHFYNAGCLSYRSYFDGRLRSSFLCTIDFK